MIHPTIGKCVKCKIIKSSFDKITMEIFQVENNNCMIKYRAFMKINGFENEGEYKMVKNGDIVDARVISYSDMGIGVVMNK